MPSLSAPEKPAYGDPCNGCGMCCLAVPCVLAEEFIGAKEGPCPALEWDDGRYWCGLLRNAHKHIPGLEGKPWADDHIRELVLQTKAFGVGCDSSDEQ